jgi:putative transposase
VKFGFVAKHRGVWPADWLCEALGVSRGGFYAWLTRPRSRRSRSEEELGAKVRASFLASDRTYGARRVWHDLLAEGVSCGLHRIERLMRLQALKARPRRRRLPPDVGERQAAAVASNVLDRSFEAAAPNRKWIADFTYVWTSEGWLYVAAVVDLFSRREIGYRPPDFDALSIARNLSSASTASASEYRRERPILFGDPADPFENSSSLDHIEQTSERSTWSSEEDRWICSSCRYSHSVFSAACRLWGMVDGKFYGFPPFLL